MKQHFVLDENIIVLAQKGEHEHGEPDPTCLALLRAILDNCHALVLHERSWPRYSSQISTLQRQRVPLVPGVMSILRSLVADLDKDTRYIADPNLRQIEGLERLPGVDTGDAEFVRAAASVPGAILVTTDGPLTTAIQTHDIDGEYGFSVLPPGKALLMAGPDPE